MGPTSTHTATVQLNLFDSIPGTPTLVAPADGATDVSTTPTFAWTADPNAASYFLEVATDAGFGTVVYSATVAAPTTSHTTNSILNVGTNYFWRVTPDNACGSGTVSAVFDFTTRPVEYCQEPALAIDSGPHFDTLTIPDVEVLQDVNLELNLDHSWIGDLIISLAHLDTGTAVSLVDQPGNPFYGPDGCNDNNLLNFLLDDESVNGPHDDACPNTDATPAYAAGSDWDPIQPLSAFDGELMDGDWQLTITDLATGRDSGFLNRWCFIPVSAPNNAPVAVGDAYTTTVGTALSIPAPGVLANDMDADGDPLTASLQSGVSNGTLVFNSDGSFTYTPAAGFVGQDSFTYRANDGYDDSNVVTVTIDVVSGLTFELYLPAVLKE